ncbi:MAG: caspase family protein [bacterium]|nr:caspase family protein [bacterium]
MMSALKAEPTGSMNPNAVPIYFFGTSAGGTTLDQGEGGGNPFASAFVELLARKELTLNALTDDLAELTELKSNGVQRPETPARSSLMMWRILPRPSKESRIALVFVFSDYSASGGATSLPGAEHDARRVSAALALAGFETQMTVDPERDNIGDILRDFAIRSADADAALLYTTGHGVEVDGIVYLLPGDYPVSERNSGLAHFALRLPEFSAAMRAKRANLIFYAGCRNDPYGQQR